MDRRPSQPDTGNFNLLSDEEFRVLPFAQRIEYLRRAIRLRNAINRQVDETLHKYPTDKPE